MTGQAFEDMQEQNIRLMQQLREKDDANFKLMSERIKSNQIHKLLKEEKEELADQLLTLKTQVSRKTKPFSVNLLYQTEKAIGLGCLLILFLACFSFNLFAIVLRSMPSCRW